MELLLKPHYTILGADLLCPFCESDYFRHGKVEIFDREEDDETGIHVSVNASRVTVDSDISGNPSVRRQGMKIHFRCEECSRASILTFAQHKGTTYTQFLKPMHPAVL